MSESVADDDDDPIVSVPDDVVLCPRCELRHRAVWASSPLYLLPEVELQEVVRSQYGGRDPDPIGDKARCPTCLGLLQGDARSLINGPDLARLCARYSSPSSFCLAISVPSLCQFRDAIVRARRRYCDQQPATTADSIIISVKDVLRAVLSAGIMAQVLPGAEPLAQSTFRIEIDLNDAEADRDLIAVLTPFLSRTLPGNLAHKHLRRTSLTSAKFLDKALDVITADELRALPLFGTCSEHHVPTARLSVSRSAVYLTGAYTKLCRRLSQTPWLVDDPDSAGTHNSHGSGGLAQSSVQEMIAAPIVSLFGPDRSYKFHSAGREDIDVRMLGSGREFLLEIQDPYMCPSEDAVQHELHRLVNASTDRVQISPLRLISDAALHFKNLELGARSKTKSYRAVVWASTALTAARCRDVSTTIPFEIEQLTPIRVLHRRALLARRRTIHRLALTPINAHFAILDLETQAGTYIKEFVHGDRGRTQPNLGSILQSQADIVQLDVLDLHHHQD